MVNNLGSLIRVLFLLPLIRPVARAIVDALGQEEGVGGDDGGHAYQDYPQPLPCQRNVTDLDHATY